MAHLILQIESSEKNCSTSLVKDGVLMEQKLVTSEQFVHAEQLHLLIKELMDSQQIEFNSLSAVAVSEGPGSYTGLRIGVAAAKGIAYACEIPLITVPTLASLTQSKLIHHPSDYFCPMMDARREEVYLSLFDKEGKELVVPQSFVFGETLFPQLDGSIAFFGSGAVKGKRFLDERFIFCGDEMNLSSNMTNLSWKKFEGKEFADLAYFEPFYLKEFVAGEPRKMWKK